MLFSIIHVNLHKRRFFFRNQCDLNWFELIFSKSMWLINYQQRSCWQSPFFAELSHFLYTFFGFVAKQFLHEVLTKNSLEQWFSTFHGLWSASRLSTLVTPCSSIGFCNITAEIFSKGLCSWPPEDRSVVLKGAQCLGWETLVWNHTRKVCRLWFSFALLLWLHCCCSNIVAVFIIVTRAGTELSPSSCKGPPGSSKAGLGFCKTDLRSTYLRKVRYVRSCRNQSISKPVVNCRLNVLKLY